MSNFDRKTFDFEAFCGRAEAAINGDPIPEIPDDDQQRAFREAGAVFLEQLGEKRAAEAVSAQQEPKGTFNVNLGKIAIPRLLDPLNKR